MPYALYNVSGADFLSIQLFKSLRLCWLWWLSVVFMQCFLRNFILQYLHDNFVYFQRVCLLDGQDCMHHSKPASTHFIGILLDNFLNVLLGNYLMRYSCWHTSVEPGLVRCQQAGFLQLPPVKGLEFNNLNFPEFEKSSNGPRVEKSWNRKLISHSWSC